MWHQAPTTYSKNKEELRTQRTVRRLIADLREVRAARICSIWAGPVGDSLFSWCASLANPANGTVYHFHLQFPSDYPASPPAVSACTPLHHPSYLPLGNNHDRGGNICCTMLEPMGELPYSGWSAAYSVLTCLIQLQSFLLDGGMTPAGEAEAAARSFSCPRCSHSPEHPTLFSLLDEGQEGGKLTVVRPLSRPRPLSIPESTEESTAKLPIVEKAKLIPSPARVQPEAKAGKGPSIGRGAWVQVKPRGSKSTPSFSSIPKKKSGGGGSSPVRLLPLQEAVPNIASNAFEALDASKPKPERPSSSSKAPRTKSQKKNLQRAEARRRSKKEEDEQRQEQEAQRKREGAKENRGDNNGESRLSPLKKKEPGPHRKLREEEGGGSSVGLWSLPFQVMEEAILPPLPPETIGALATTNQHLRLQCDSGYLWRNLFERHCPHSTLTASTLEDWKHCYLLEANQIAEGMRCFYTKQGPDGRDGAILGVPVEYTTNPKTRRVDYISSSMDILSHGAYTIDRVRKTVWGEDFTDFLPLYISHEHFSRALPLLRTAILKLAPDWRTGGRFEPEMALDVLPKLMTTLIVQIADKATHCSERVLEGYCQVHRLLLALIQEYRLERVVERRLRDFVDKSASRSKEICPALGTMAALASVCDSVPWGEFVRAYLEESFDRNVLWACKAYPGLANTDNVTGAVDMERIDNTFKACKVSLRLSMFHSFFVNHVAKPVGMSLSSAADIADQFYGRPSRKLKEAFNNAVQRILRVQDWPSFFQAVSLKTPSKSYLTGWLVQSVKASARKGYHTKGMDFNRIHQSGVSKILLKGESYKAGRNLRHIRLEQAWGNAHNFLDASCICLDVEGKVKGIVDFQNTHYQHCLTHSGDVMDYDRDEGRHTIRLDLDRLPRSVTHLYFAISAWEGDLSSFRQPWVQFIDDTSKVELCRYDLEAQSSHRHETSILMCMLARSGPKGDSQEWAVTALGEFGEGSARNYKPITDALAKRAKP